MAEKPPFKTPRTRGHKRSRGNIGLFETFKDNNKKLVQKTLIVTF